MLTYTNQRNLFGDLTENSTTANLTLGDTLINSYTKKIFAKKDWHFLEATATETTTASGQFYNMPYNARKLLSAPTMTVSSTIYTPQRCPNREFWDRLNISSYAADIPQYYYIFGGQVGFYPKTNASNTITFSYLKGHKDLSIADYTTGSITTATNGSTAIVGSGTTWTAKMAGRWLKITDSDTANTGDGEWYEISSVTDATNLVLKREYGGTSISAGSADYTIGQISALPDGFHELPVYMAVEDYYIRDKKPALADRYRILAQELERDLNKMHGNKTSDVNIYPDEPEVINPNLYPKNLA